MKNSFIRQVVVPLAVAAVFAALPARADLVSDLLAFNNATIQPTGPRAGSLGKGFFNIEGDGNGDFASYGVVDFDTGGFGITPGIVGGVNSLTVSFAQSNAGFTTDGALGFYLTTDTATSIDEGGSPLSYNTPSAINNGGIGSALSILYQLGTGTFSQVESGFVDSYTFTLAGLATEVEDYVADILNSGETLRVVVVPEDTTVAATWAGFSNSSFSGPQLSIDYDPIPEPSVIAMLVLGGMGAICLLRRRRSIE